MLRPIAVALAVAAVTAGCGPFGDDKDGSMRELAAAVEDAGHTGEPVQLSSITEFEWDRVYVFASYASPEKVKRELGFEWQGAEDTASRFSDALNLIVFVEDRRVVKAFDHDVAGGNVACLDPSVVGSGGLTQEEAVLRVDRIPLGDSDSYDVVTLAHPRTDREVRRLQRCLRHHY